MHIYHEPRQMRDGLALPFYCHIQQHAGTGPMANLHLHDMVELLYAYSGTFELTIDDQSFRFGEGAIAFIGALGIHRVEALSEGKNEYAVIQFEPEWVYAQQPAFTLPALSAFMLRSAQQPCVFSSEDLEDTVMPTLILDIIREYMQKELGYEAAIRADIHRLVLWFMRKWRADDPSLLDGISDGENARHLQGALAYLMQHYASPIHLGDVAAVCGMSESAFSKFFFKHTRKHFVDYLCDLRIAKSEWLLAATQQSITDIAYDVGFSTASYFIHRFRAAIGMTPLQFRRQFRGDGTATGE